MEGGEWCADTVSPRLSLFLFILGRLVVEGADACMWQGWIRRRDARPDDPAAGEKLPAEDEGAGAREQCEAVNVCTWKTFAVNLSHSSIIEMLLDPSH